MIALKPLGAYASGGFVFLWGVDGAERGWQALFGLLGRKRVASVIRITWA